MKSIYIIVALCLFSACSVLKPSRKTEKRELTISEWVNRDTAAVVTILDSKSVDESVDEVITTTNYLAPDSCGVQHVASTVVVQRKATILTAGKIKYKAVMAGSSVAEKNVEDKSLVANQKQFNVFVIAFVLLVGVLCFWRFIVSKFFNW